MKVAIIGAGAAGLMCACTIDASHDVTVFDKNESVGKKLLLTGNGRCNLTNLVSADEFLKSVPQNAEFFESSLRRFTPKDTVAFLEKLGIQTQVEDNNRVFPKSGGAKAVAKALHEYAVSRGIKFEFSKVVTDIEKLRTQFDAVIIATGGASYPQTGSNGDGFKFAVKLGHKVNPPRPALCGLQFQTSTGFQGTSVTVCATLGGNTEVDDMMFTKNGVGGPVIFKLSSKYSGQSIQGKTLTLDFLPNIDNPTFDPNDKPFFAFRKYVPQNIANWLVAIGAKPPNIKSIRVPIKDFEDIKTATVTRGGVDVKEINPETMESKLVSKLFFSGEVLDIDGLSGGFNLQIAFSTAFACAEAIGLIRTRR